MTGDQEAGAILRAEADGSRCLAVGNCAALAPAVFDQSDDDGTVVLLDATVPPHQRESAREAARRCPAGAIALYESAPAHDA
ncbi:ferredoxin [Streptomyces poriticola]|uniref:ferredoxin n=1 Tax=Streptomyces poriticola TaxID=3120506 RepID=UPI002FCE5B48